ncbi:putative protein N(5)-glutamine methyltransferase [Leifsonia sp. A12D58]|uniref:putative protein N(5)-glutamine methyltransferase n=1 Tax=Leifsonia sp. A12D58 TaxID=3397674 RepID=UPI0039DFF92F
MTAQPLATTRSDVILTLRAAGCVFAEDEGDLLLAAADGNQDALTRAVDQRVAGVPLEYILGWAEFFGQRVCVDVGVFVPRRRTELLVREAINLARDPEVIVDLCCGTGAVGAALAIVLPDADVHATDIEPAAVRCARRNLDPLGGQVYEGDLYDSLPRILQNRVDLLVVNAPYVPTDAIAMMPPEARLHEPLIALDGGEDGLDVQRSVAQDALRWLSPGGHVLIETSALQAPRTAGILAGHGLDTRVVHSDGLDATVVVGTKVAN